MEQEKRFDGLVVVVTGAGRGMGREHALLLASRGAKVVVNDISDGARETAKMITDTGGAALANIGDISIKQNAVSIIEDAVSHFGRIDIVVCNAGIVKSVPFADMDEKVFDAIIRTNLYGTFHILKTAWPYFIRQKYGRVVIVSSGAALAGHPQVSAYSASKGALMGLGKTLALEGKEHGIHVNILMPAALTAMTAENKDEQTKKRQKMMPPHLVSPVVAWLAHQDNTLNGQIIDASAGRAALNFTGLCKGYWKKELAIEDLFKNQEKVLDQTGFATLTDTGMMSQWALDNTGWDKL